MGKALQVVSGRASNPSSTFTGLTANTGDSFTVRNFTGGAAYLVEAWAQEGTVGTLRVRSSLLHDNAQGIRLRVQASARPLLPYEADQPLTAQDLLTVELTGGAAETDVGALLLYYQDLPGAAARLASWQEIQPRIVDLAGVESNLTTGGTAGQYGGSAALNANFDVLQRNRDYAILGYLVDTTVGVVGWQGPDTSNLRVGGPGIADPDVTSDWFVQLDRANPDPMIPVFNSANVGATTIDLVHTATGTTVNVTTIVALLSGAGGIAGV
jgi:hypothetical protein